MTKQESSVNVEKPTHFIGIGASAGGLEAIQTLLQHLPVDTGACFVIVQHLSPDFKSMMLELLSKHTSMQIHNVTDGMQLEANNIYLIPPRKNMMIAEGLLLLSDKMPDSGLNLPIDIFFRSLSEDQQEKAIGIILSGTGSDGSRGLKALKEAGALVIAQEPDSAKFDGMPTSAINTGIIDLVLRPEDIGQKLKSYIEHPIVKGQQSSIHESMSSYEDTLSEIFNVLKMKSEIDFAKYKASTVARRIERRMTIKQVNSLQDYLTLLFKEPYEVDTLSKELLIGVTRFFRDEEAYQHLKENVIPNIVSEKMADEPIRVWVAGCSSGEEAYSMALLFADELQKQNTQRVVKVFATDVNSHAIADASNGEYSEDIKHDVPAHLLSNYFSKTAQGKYQVNKAIRQMVIFATHNMIVDPPFSNMDLVSCRNVLIYFQQSVQKRVLSSLHFALRKEGVLFLGSSESLAELAQHFNPINERCRLFKKSSNVRLVNNTKNAALKNESSMTTAIPSVSRLMRTYRNSTVNSSAINFANQALINQYAPPSVLLNDDHEALHVYGDVSEFMRRLPPGRISIDIKEMVNEDMNIAVSSALHRAKQSGEPVYYTDVFTQNNEKVTGVNLRVSYLKEHDIENSPGYYWLIFEKISDKEVASPVESISFNAAEQSRLRIDDLESELKRNKEHLQVTVEELETTNEELQSANEELMSANEELQSTNEELQSVNEELYTVNSEYQEKLNEISEANSDLDKVLNLSNIGIVFLDENMLIRRFTKAASKYINLMETDINRPLHHISKNISYPGMLEDVSNVYATGEAIEQELMLEDKRLLHISINPYNSETIADSKGVAITFSDVSRATYTEKAMSIAYNELRKSIQNILDTVDQVQLDGTIELLVVDDDHADQIIIKEYLTDLDELNVNIHSAASVDEAISQLGKTNIDICLVDYYLNNETAIELIEKSNNANQTIPTVVITASPDTELKARLISHGALDLIDKNELSKEHLTKVIRYAIRRYQIDNQIQQVIEKSS